MGKNVPGHVKNVLFFKDVICHNEKAPISTSTSTSSLLSSSASSSAFNQPMESQEHKNTVLKNKRIDGEYSSSDKTYMQTVKKTKNNHQNIRSKEFNSLVGHNSNRITNFLYHNTKKC